MSAMADLIARSIAQLLISRVKSISKVIYSVPEKDHLSWP